jgi:hypothetical protein
MIRPVNGSAAVTINNFAAQNVTSYFGSSGGNQKDSLTGGNEIYCCSGTLGSLVTLGGTSYTLSILTTEQSAAFNQGAQASPVSYTVSESEYVRAKSVHTAHLNEWMSKPGIQGFGIGSKHGFAG